ncbi:hypothetical protein [Corynebacterium xerosis]|uniref:hypothetical protein n=1 Tax=Corynebacterium xerosis TaxID=1725 RepID=UPI0027B8CE26|nr:hypothetical protein [Corynebacterium xerosis]
MTEFARPDATLGALARRFFRFHPKAAQSHMGMRRFVGFRGRIAGGVLNVKSVPELLS